MNPAVLSFLPLGAILGLACSSTPSASGAASSDGGGLSPADCDPGAEPKDAAGCVVDGFGVFVDGAGGDDANAGTKASPFKTIGAAVAKRGDAKRVYVCEGTYAEHVKVDAGVSIYGGFACAGWGYTGGKAKIAPADEGYALEVSGVSDPVVFADLEVVAKDATAPGGSSIAAWVRGSAGVTFNRCTLKAGNGAKGADGVKGAEGALASSMPTEGTLDGNDATGNGGAPAQFCTCVGMGTSKGGAGAALGGDGSPGETVQPSPEPPGATGAGSTFGQCGLGDAGKTGSKAPDQTHAAGAIALGSLSSDVWTPGIGGVGARALAGQGGGGGGGNAGGGGGGACGGCGGAGGSGGTGGGASVALATVDSALKLTTTQLVAGVAGAGGAGGAGGDGQAGGVRGVGSGAACNGGNGGRGGNGGAGGGGAGGISVGVLYKGPAPTLESTTIALGTPGAKGAGGAPGVNDGIDGIAAETFEAP